jgi:DNA-binding NtrC family response regulator
MPLNVWYIDDEPDLCELFFEIFSTDEIVITTFTNPNVAIEQAQISPPDILIVDYRLPNTTGDQVAQQFPLELPKYLMTGDITVVTSYKFLKVFPKPYLEEDILEILTAQSKAA